MTVYLDTSALVKVVAPEVESGALLIYLADHPEQATSIVAHIELRRAARRRPGVDPRRVDEVLDRPAAIALTTSLVDEAAAIDPASLRTLDAIHLASAGLLGSDLEAIVTYDRRLADAAQALGLPVASPGA